MASAITPLALKFGRIFARNITLNNRSIIRETNFRLTPLYCNFKTYSSNLSEEKQKETQESDAMLDINKLKTDLESITKEKQTLTDKSKEIEEKYMRTLADRENLRVRLNKQIEEAKIFGIQSFCKDLLDVADILSKATETVPKDAITDSNPHLKNLFEGLTMIDAQLQNVFKRHGLVKVNPLDEKFDPNIHEALFQQEIPGKEAGIVIEVSKIGYKLKERVIRPALVGVSKGP